MSAGQHECRSCKGQLNLNLTCNCNRNAGNVPVKPLTQPLAIHLQRAMVTLALSQAFAKLAA